MERKLLIKDGIQYHTGQAITENYFKEMIDTLAVIRKPLENRKKVETYVTPTRL